MVINKAALLAKGCSQQESIDYTKTFACVARLEAIKLLVTFRIYSTYDSTTLVSFFSILFKAFCF